VRSLALGAVGPLVLLDIRGLTKEYKVKRFFSKAVITRAVDNVDFQIDKTSVIALVGASGSGKSTLSRCLAGIERPTTGVILYRGTDLSTLTSVQMRDYRRSVQIVFQNAADSINPRFTASFAVSESLEIQGTGTAEQRKKRAMYWLEQVGLRGTVAERPALELSGGERQRLAIARSLVSNPEVIIFDEAFSGLDLPVAARLLTVLGRVRASQGLTYLFVGHDLNLVQHICSEVAVMYDGRIVERGQMRNFLSAPQHSYSRKLVQAIPRLPLGWPA
jgi:ABC-type glutathione transport system ATPase component